MFQLCAQWIVKRWAPLHKSFSNIAGKVVTQEEKSKIKLWNVSLSSYMVSTVHAVICFSLALYTCTVEEQFKDLTKSVIGRSEVTIAAILISLGYFLYDLQMVLHYYPDLGTYPIILHHVMYLAGGIACVLYDHAYYIIILFNLTELSTPFTNLRYFLSEAGYDVRFPVLFTINGLLMWLMFGLTRVYLCLWFFPVRVLWGQWQHLTLFPLAMIIYTVVLYLGISALNLFWFYKITCGLFNRVKIFLSKSNKAA
jgi:hypothetical protein